MKRDGGDEGEAGSWFSCSWCSRNCIAKPKAHIRITIHRRTQADERLAGRGHVMRVSIFVSVQGSI
jgi:hypothetical protein